MKYLRKMSVILFLFVAMIVMAPSMDAHATTLGVGERPEIEVDDPNEGVYYYGLGNTRIDFVVYYAECDLTVSSSNPAVMDVSAVTLDSSSTSYYGLPYYYYHFFVTAKAAGSATITIKDNTSGVTETIPYQVMMPQLNMYDEEIAYVKKGSTTTLRTPYLTDEDGEYIYGVQTSFQYTSSNPAVVAVSAKGNLSGKKVGKAVITIKELKTGLQEQVTVACYKAYTVKTKLSKGKIYATPSMLSLSKDSIECTSYYNSYSKKGNNEETVQLQNFYSVTSGMYLPFKDSKKKLDSVFMDYDGTIHLYFKDSLAKGKTHKGTVSIKIAGKTLKLKYKCKIIGFSADTYKLKRGDKKSFQLKGYSGKIKYTSSNKSVATISSKGMLKVKKPGVTIVTATVKGRKFSAVVNVAKNANVWKLLDRQQYILNHWTYSQENRNTDGYYDCSSLVYRTFKQYEGIDFGNSYSAWSGSEADWCMAHVSQISYSINNMKLQPADLGICYTDDWTNQNSWHAQTFAYYAFGGYSAKGKPRAYEVWSDGRPRTTPFRVFRPLDVVR